MSTLIATFSTAESMAKRPYTAPQTEIIRSESLCETVPVYFSQAGPGDVGGKGNDFDYEDDFEYQGLFDDNRDDESPSFTTTGRNLWAE